MNCDNFLGDRSSTRVHAPPGGASSFSLGWDAPAEKPAPRRAAPVASAAPAFAPAEPAPKPAYADYSAPASYSAPADYSAAPAAAAPVAAAASGPAVSANKFASGANQNCGNFITGRSTTRIHHAPGGHSSISLG